MIENQTLRWALMVLLLAAALYAAFRAIRKSPPATRVGLGLHAAMLTAMALMLSPGLQWPALPQVLGFGLAAWWFVLRAVSWRPVPGDGPPVPGRPVPKVGPGHGRRAGRARRGSLVYNALTMAAMAFMLAVMDFRTARGPQAAGSDAAGSLGQAAHHGGASAPGLPLPGPHEGWGAQAALVLAVAFGLAAAVWAVHLLRGRRSHNGQGRGETFLDLVGAASMAVMFAAIAS